MPDFTGEEALLLGEGVILHLMCSILGNVWRQQNCATFHIKLFSVLCSPTHFLLNKKENAKKEKRKPLLSVFSLGVPEAFILKKNCSKDIKECKFENQGKRTQMKNLYRDQQAF